MKLNVAHSVTKLWEAELSVEEIESILIEGFRQAGRIPTLVKVHVNWLSNGNVELRAEDRTDPVPVVPEGEST